MPLPPKTLSNTERLLPILIIQAFSLMHKFVHKAESRMAGAVTYPTIHIFTTSLPNVLIRPVFFVAKCFVYFHQYVHAFRDFTKDSMLSIQIVQVFSQSKEKLYRENRYNTCTNDLLYLEKKVDSLGWGFPNL